VNFVIVRIAIVKYYSLSGSFLIFCTREQEIMYKTAFGKYTNLEVELSLIFNNRNMFTHAQLSKSVRDHCFFGVRGFKKPPSNRDEYKRFINFPPFRGPKHRFNKRNEEFSNSNVVLYFKPTAEEYVKDSNGKNLRSEQKPIDLLKELIVMCV